MQIASNAFDNAMKNPIRNRGYIKISIGIVNSNAQNNASVVVSKSPVTYFSDIKKPFEGYAVSRVYATAEQDFSKVDGTMYFLPVQNQRANYYNNGIVANNIGGIAYISFNGMTGLDIKGLTIDFGEYYPTSFTIESDSGMRGYTNDSSLFVTEDSFDGTSYFIITPITMVNGQGRLRIHQLTFGIANTFSNEKVKNYRIKECISPTSETIPSTDTTIVVDNQELYYSVDNPQSAISYMEVGQEVKTAFGYDVTGEGDIEWLPETTTYLNTWSANDEEAEFTSTDRFYRLDDTYYGGLYRAQGITLYDLALDVFTSAGITDSREYYIDPYLKKIVVYNPLPVAKHSEELQIIANAGRCVLYEDRSNRIHLKSSFVPDMIASSQNQTLYSSTDDLLKLTKKRAYAVCSNDFSTVDGTMLFLPESTGKYLKGTGYISNSVSDSEGNFSENPVITITLESAFVAFGLIIHFHNVSPHQFKIETYYENAKVQEVTVENPGLEYITDERFENFDSMKITFTKGYPNSRVFVDDILISDVTNYILTRNHELTESPTGTRQKKIKNINIAKTNYRKSSEGIKELLSEEIPISSLENNEYTAYFNIASYGYSATVKNNSKVSATILESSNYFVKVKFSGITTEKNISLSIEGYEYVVDETYYRKQHNASGQEVNWNNPLISTDTQARDLEEWIATYYLGDVDYEISWRGDPRAEANDLFYLELKNRDYALIRSYENELEFDGSWAGKMKARRTVMSWQ